MVEVAGLMTKGTRETERQRERGGRALVPGGLNSPLKPGRRREREREKDTQVLLVYQWGSCLHDDAVFAWGETYSSNRRLHK